VNPSQGSVAAHRIEVHVDRTTVLPGRVWCAERPRALIAVCHGIGEHSGRYAALASDLVAARYTVVALDLPGHGEARGPRGDAQSWALLRDHVVPAMFTATRGLPDQPPQLPQVLFGHSLGGILALDFALAHPRAIIGAVASAPGLKTAIPPWWKLALANVARSTTPSAGFPTGLDESAMSRDAQVIRLRKEDPLVHDKISPRLYFEFNEARQRVVRNARRLQVPTLIQHGAGDSVTDPRGSLEFNAAAPHGMVRLITYKDAYHELFNDPARDEALKDLKGWLELAVVM
jgi:alpha-beta hydrolase superfamily lysophospholipase